jgi:GNAT superfamily N-acetyltransferase
MDAIAIRPARPGDGTGIAGAWLDAGRTYVAIAPELFRIPEESGLVESFESDLASDRTEEDLWLVAESEGEVAGWLTARIEAPSGEPRHQLVRRFSEHRLQVDALVVATANRRRGVGTALMEAAEAWGRDRGARIAVLDTFIDSPMSVRFYEARMGYRRHSIVFSKPLTSIEEAE